MNADSADRSRADAAAPVAADATPIEALRAMLESMLRRRVALVETHISWVLLDGEHAWKVKKPVTLGFLDFARLETRRACCEEELRLNRRLAPGLYRDVVAIRGSPAAPRLDGDAPPIEYAVRMRQFADGSLFSERLAAGALRLDEVERFAARLARFQREAPAAGDDVPWGSAARVRADTALALDGIARAAPSAVSWVEAMRERLEAQAQRLRECFEQRRRDGWIREGHGDLHLANVVVLGDDVTAFDCIEFDPALRWIDVQSDAAFLAMDLLAHDRRDLAFAFLDTWLAELGDYGGVGLLRYYLVYRALVRELVASIRAAQDASEPAVQGESSQPPAQDPPGFAAPGEAGSADPPMPAGRSPYGELASQLLRAHDPRLVIAYGVSGSGKSWLSHRLLATVGAIRLRSDVERKRLLGLGARDRTHSGLDAGAYAADTNARTYDRLLEASAVALDAGWPTIVDATFLRAADRDRFRALARERGVPFTILACEADVETLRARVSKRSALGADASEADLGVLARQLDARDPLRDDERRAAIVVDTAQPVVDASAIARQWLAARAAPKEAG